MTELNCIEPLFWGLQSYATSFRFQEEAWKRVTFQNHPGFILGGEIKPTITQGIRAKQDDILQPQACEIFKVKRGGETTLHSPGQLVIYPILNVRNLDLGVREFVRMLLRVSTKTFSEFGVQTLAKEDPVGLFTEKGKIGFCGLQIKNGVSLHGLALNIQNNLELFDSIISCGLKQVTYDKLENYSPVRVQDFFNRWVEKAFLEDSLQKNQMSAKDWPLKETPSLKFSGPAFLN